MAKPSFKHCLLFANRRHDFRITGLFKQLAPAGAEAEVEAQAQAQAAAAVAAAAVAFAVAPCELSCTIPYP